ncbi:MAG: hypothetical protein QOE90_51 [Thermoplasmata archaeon]|jgi:hypothetical protein|nr:hypothetical protein [Thermoplasmata archaeon]
MRTLPLLVSLALLGGFVLVLSPAADACVATPSCFGGPCQVTYGSTDDIVGDPALNVRYPNGVECVSSGINPPCHVTWRQVYLDMDHATDVPDGVECVSCHVTGHYVYLDMDHPTFVPDGVDCS